MEIRRASSGAVVINDAYNANPASTEAALRSLAALPARRRIAVLGVMAELGEAGPSEHKRIAAAREDLGIEVVAVDAPDYGVPVVHGIDGARRGVATRRRRCGPREGQPGRWARSSGLRAVDLTPPYDPGPHGGHVVTARASVRAVV